MWGLWRDIDSYRQFNSSTQNARSDGVQSLGGQDVPGLILDVPRGTPVRPFINGRHRVGEALMAGSDRNEIEGRGAELRRRLALTAV